MSRDGEGPAAAVERRALKVRMGRVLVLLALAAVVVRVAAAGMRGDYLSFDESMYIILGKNLLWGHGYTLNALPNVTFPFILPILAGIVEHFGGPRLALSLPSAVLGGLAVIPLYLLARKMAGETVAFASALLFVGFPSLIQFTPFVSYGRRLYDGSEQVYIFFLLFAAYFAYAAAVDGRWRDYVAGGLFAGAAFEVRQDGGVCALMVFLWLVGAALARRQWRSVGKAGAFAAAAIALAMPFLWHVRAVTGVWGPGTRLAGSIPMRSSFELVIRKNDWQDALKSLFALNEKGTELRTPYYGVSPWHRSRFLDGEETADVGRALRDMRPGYLPEALRDYVLWAIPDRFGYVALAGIAGLLLWPRRWTNAAFLVALFVPAVLAALFLFPLARFWMFLTPFVVMLIAWGIVFVLGLFTRVAPKLSLWAAIASLAVAAAVSGFGAYDGLKAQESYRRDLRNYERTMEELDKTAARWLVVNTAPWTRVMASGPQPALLAGREWLVLPIDTGERVLAYARLKKAGIIVLTSSEPGKGAAALEPYLKAIFAQEGNNFRATVRIYDLEATPGAPMEMPSAANTPQPDRLSPAQ